MDLHFDASNSQCQVLTRRTGLLRPVGHDLLIAVGEYRIELRGIDGNEPSVEAEFAAHSVHVVAALEGDRPREGALSIHDRDEINRQIAEDVLESARFPRITFRSTRIERGAERFLIHGRLTLHGTEHDLTVVARRARERIEAKAVVRQPDYGITPFKAFAGALKVAPDVVVRVAISAAGVP